MKMQKIFELTVFSTHRWFCCLQRLV